MVGSPERRVRFSSDTTSGTAFRTGLPYGVRAGPSTRRLSTPFMLTLLDVGSLIDRRNDVNRAFFATSPAGGPASTIQSHNCPQRRATVALGSKGSNGTRSVPATRPHRRATVAFESEGSPRSAHDRRLELNLPNRSQWGTKSACDSLQRCPRDPTPMPRGRPGCRNFAVYVDQRRGRHGRRPLSRNSPSGSSRSPAARCHHRCFLVAHTNRATNPRNTCAARFLGSISQTSLTPASKYSLTLRAISGLVFPVLSTSTARSGARSGIGSVGLSRPGCRSQLMNDTSGMHKSWCNAHHAVCAGADPKVRLLEVVIDQEYQTGRQPCFIESHGFLHQGTVD